MKYSVLDLAPVPEGADVADAMRNTTDLAQRAEALGYHRYWMAEHHNMPGIASAATSVLIGHVASHTKTMRVGSGGIMLPNHAPLQIAEQFGTLAALYGDRIDLGLGRAPGGDQAVYMALRRTGGDNFPADVAELMGYLGDPIDGATVRALPGEGSHVPIWILGHRCMARNWPRTTVCLRLCVAFRACRSRGSDLYLSPRFQAISAAGTAVFHAGRQCVCSRNR